MSYFDPLNTNYENTRLQIQQSLLNLEAKLLKRKQLQVPPERNIFQAQTIYRPFINTQAYPIYSPQIQLRNSLLNLRSFEPLRTQSINRINNFDVDYFERLNALKRERQLLDSRQNALMKNSHLKNQFSEVKKYNYNQEQQSAESIAKKYYDGTKIKEYNQQLFGYNEKIATNKNNVLQFRKSSPSKNKQLYGKQLYHHEQLNLQNKISQKGNDNPQEYTPMKNLFSTSSKINKIEESSPYSQLQPVYQKSKSKNSSPLKLRQQQQIRNQFHASSGNFQHKTAGILGRKHSKSSLQKSYHNSSSKKFETNRPRNYSNSKQLSPNFFPRSVQSMIKSRLKKVIQELIVIEYEQNKDFQPYMYAVYEKQQNQRLDLLEKITKNPDVIRRMTGY